MPQWKLNASWASFDFHKVVRLVKAGIDAVAGRAMQVEADMQTMVLRFARERLDFVHLPFVDFINVGGRNVFGSVEIEIARIGDRQSDKIEAPIHHPFELIICSAAAIGVGKIREIKAAPPREGIGGWLSRASETEDNSFRRVGWPRLTGRFS